MESSVPLERATIVNDADAQAPAPLVVQETPEEIPEVTQQPLTEAEWFAAENVLLLTGLDSNRDAALQRDQALLMRAVEGQAWDAYRGLLARSIHQALKQTAMGEGLNRYDPVWNQPILYQALLRWRTLGVFPESQIAPLVSDAYTGAFLIWLLGNNQAMEEVLMTVQPGDDPGYVLKFLQETWPLNTGKFEKYFTLALACAVVFDNPVAISHPLGDSTYGTEQTVDPFQRYQWFVEKNEKGKLAAPVHHSSARDLVWVVCAPVATSELDWSIDKMHLRRSKWGNAYGMVRYLMERAVEGENPYEEYSFEEILKEGGICGDQTYFCVNTARAQGIPAMNLVGETSLGGHAWAGLKTSHDEWTTAVGRVGGVSKGTTRNPQTGAQITEQEIQHWNDRSLRSKVTTLSVWRHLWLADFFLETENDDENAAVVLLAHRLGRSFPETWRALYSLLERQMELTGDPAEPSNLDAWKTFAKDMRREFQDNPRMAGLAADAEVEYIFPYGAEGDAKRSLLRERRRIERDSGEQADLIAASLKREADLMLKLRGPDALRDISRLYDRALRDYGGSITGFKMMAENYFGFFRDKDHELARKAARDIELAFKRVVESGSKDWFRTQTEAGIHRMICGYYRAAGDPDRADMLQKRYELLVRRAKRSAL